MAPKLAMPAMPDVDAEEEEDVTDAEAAAILKEVLMEDKPPPKPKPPPPKPPLPPAVPPPLPAGPPIPEDSAGKAVDSRVQEMQAAAVIANKAGRKGEALHWLRQSKELVQRVTALLDSEFPPPSTRPYEAPPALSGAGAPVPAEPE